MEFSETVFSLVTAQIHLAHCALDVCSLDSTPLVWQISHLPRFCSYVTQWAPRFCNLMSLETECPLFRRFSGAGVVDQGRPTLGGVARVTKALVTALLKSNTDMGLFSSFENVIWAFTTVRSIIKQCCQQYLC